MPKTKSKAASSAGGTKSTAKRKKKVGRPFVKGDKRINRKGPKPQHPALKAKCKDLTEELFGIVVQLARGQSVLNMAKDGEEWKPVGVTTPSSRDQLRAAELLLAYGHGRPTQLVGEDPESRFLSFAEIVKAAKED